MGKARKAWRKLAGLLVVFFLGASGSGKTVAQVPYPKVPNLYERSGLVNRYTPVIPRLPEDKKRDSFLGTRYQDEHDNKFKLHPADSFKDGGMYGRPLCQKCTRAIWPFFTGSTGGRIDETCAGCHSAWGRWVVNAVAPFRPVGMYYDRGVYVPIYDMDYAVPGPGPFPWSHFFKRPTGG